MFDIAIIGAGPAGSTLARLAVGKTIARESAVINRPVSTSPIYNGAGGVALLGEAAGWISPSSAEGFSYAFKSARCLGDILIASDSFLDIIRIKCIIRERRSDLLVP